MTENRCIEVLKKMKHMFTETCAKIDENTALDMAAEAIKEIQQYRVIGTVQEVAKLSNSWTSVNYKLRQFEKIGTIEEFKALKEKSVAKKPKKKNSNKVIFTQDSYAYCPHCKNPVQIWNRSCEKCGGELDWH